MNLQNPKIVSPNQPPLKEAWDLFEEDSLLKSYLPPELSVAARESFAHAGKVAGNQTTLRHGFLANQNSPELKIFDRLGNRIDEAEFHPSWHALMQQSCDLKLHRPGFFDAQNPWASYIRNINYYFMAQAEAGHICPVTMTHAAGFALRDEPAFQKPWIEKLATGSYDSEFKPIAQKKGVVFGMAMTEKQGGSDVRANQTRAEFQTKEGDLARYHLSGHKWFCSAPMSDAFLVLAQAAKGLSCFLVPRFLPDGSRNPFFLQRLKDKLGNRSNASSEVEFEGTAGYLIGEEGRGVPVIMKMVNSTRMDCILGSLAMCRMAYHQVLHHVKSRSAFGNILVSQPLMQQVLVDLGLELEGMMALAMSINSLLANPTPQNQKLTRLAVAFGKYWVCKRALAFTAEAMECLGGNGYVEESILPRLYREAPVNSIWEGSGNINCLDVLRILGKEPEIFALFHEHVVALLQSKPQYASEIQKIGDLLKSATAEVSARYACERMAVLFAASGMRSIVDDSIVDAFLKTRLENRGTCFGALTSKPAISLVERYLS